MIGLSKQAKILSKNQIDAVLGYLSKTRSPIRTRVIFLLSVKAGLRAKEIACLSWEMLTDAEGNIGSSIQLLNNASKGKSGRVIPLNRELQSALLELKSWNSRLKRSPFVVATERSNRTSPAAIANLFACWYSDLGFIGCSSHFGRRTAITAWARRISTVGGSLRDVQLLAGHSALTTTQRYIEGSMDAQKRIVDLI